MRPRFALRLALPSIGLALVAWPHYLLNIPRYLAYAKATAGGYAYNPVEATGLDFARYAVGDLIWEVFGLGGTALLLAGAGGGRARLAAAAGGGTRLRAAGRPGRGAALPGLPVLAQPDRALHGDQHGHPGLSGRHPARRGAAAGRRARTARALAGGAGAAALAQLALAWWVALAGPVEARPLRPMVEAAWRPNFACDFRAADRAGTAAAMRRRASACSASPWR